MTQPRLTGYELEIMDVVWTRGAATVQQVCDALAGDRAYTTIMTTMSLLERKKGVLRSRKQGRAYLYEPTVTRADVSRTVLAELRDRLFGGSTSSLMLNLISHEKLSSSEIQAVRAALQKLEDAR